MKINKKTIVTCRNCRAYEGSECLVKKEVTKPGGWCWEFKEKKEI